MSDFDKYFLGNVAVKEQKAILQKLVDKYFFSTGLRYSGGVSGSTIKDIPLLSDQEQNDLIDNTAVIGIPTDPCCCDEFFIRFNQMQDKGLHDFIE